MQTVTDPAQVRFGSRAAGFIERSPFARLATTGREGEHLLASGGFVHRRHDGGKPRLYRIVHFWMCEDVELILADRVEDTRGDIRWVEPGLYPFSDFQR